jgi:hypothetical protein
VSDDLVVPTDDAVERIVEMIRKRLTDARENGQTVRMTARETGRRRIPVAEFERMSIMDALTNTQPSGFELYISIEGKS